MFKNILFAAIIASTSALRTITIPREFKLGTATAAYQIEGGWNADGKGPSIWDTFTHTYPHLIADGSNGDVAANSYELYEEDVAALKSIGAQFYRLSISWPRVLPTGEISSRNEAGIQYYHNLIDALIREDIEPVITMYHWDLPQHLSDLGGFTNPMFVNYFEQYANLLFNEYGHKIKSWMTFNEPINYCGLGYADGIWPPKFTLSGVGDYLCAHHTILAHARAYHLYKDNYYATQRGRVGISLYSNFAFPEDVDNPEHIAAAEREVQFTFGIYAHPIFSATGDYPQVVRERVEQNSNDQGYTKSRLPKFTTEEINYVKGSADFLGLNFYTSYYANEPETDDNFVQPSRPHDAFVNLYQDPTRPTSASGITSHADGLYSLLNWIKGQYNNVEVIITENGWGDAGELDDIGRIAYLGEHLEAIINAIDDGCNVTGHTTWSLIDNFEWHKGFTEKFGVFRVDVTDETLARQEKSSTGWLRNVIANRQFTIAEEDD